MEAKGSQVFEKSGKVVLSLQGIHTETEAAACTAEASRLIRRLGRCEFVVDLRELKSYEPGARTLWQDNLALFRKSIHTVTMVGGSALARMTGAAVCLYAGIKMRLVQTLEEAVREPTK